MPARSRRPKAAPQVRRPPPDALNRPPASAVLALLVLLAIAAYFPILSTTGGWLWDDEGHVTGAALRSVSGLWRIWFDLGATQQYYPVVHSAFWLESHLFGTASPVAYHWVSVLLHAGSAFLLFRILRTLAVPGALVGAALFLLHPVQVESVAWVSELKNTLSCVFFLAAAHVYLRFDDRRRPRDYGLALFLFALALLSKSVTATLPAILLVLVWWRRRRIEAARDVMPLLPFAAFSLALAFLTVWFERYVIGAAGQEFQFTILERFLIAGRALWFYASSLLWPATLSFNYPRWQVSQTAVWQYLFPASVALTLAVAWRWRAVFVGALIFCIALAPALGFVNVYPFRFSFVADHFQYHASAAFLALAGAGIALAAGQLRLSRAMAAAGVAALVLVLGATTYARSRRFIDGPTLYRETIARNPESWFAHNNLAALIVTRQAPFDLTVAAAHAREALRLKPDYTEARFNLAIALDDLGDAPGAIREFQALLAESTREELLRSKRATVNRRLGLALAKSGRAQEALPYLREAATLDSTNAEPLINLGAALIELGDPLQARQTLEEAVRRDPRAADAWHNLGNAHLLLHRYPDAAQAFEQEVRLRPNDLDAQAALARARALAGK